LPIIHVLVADDNSILRAGYRRLLEAMPDVCIVGEVADGDAALRAAETLAPDVLIADVSMPYPNGIDIARALRQSGVHTPVLVLTIRQDSQGFADALASGASGCLVKRCVEPDLPDAVRTLAGGDRYGYPDGLSRTKPSSGAKRDTKVSMPAVRAVRPRGCSEMAAYS
jgi:DNA-binding NarL/FixJ family response regulator